jgi:hypothetical protein
VVHHDATRRAFSQRDLRRNLRMRFGFDSSGLEMAFCCSGADTHTPRLDFLTSARQLSIALDRAAPAEATLEVLRGIALSIRDEAGDLCRHADRLIIAFGGEQ